MITNKKLNIAIIEDSIIWGNKNANLSKLEENLQYIPQETDIVILPELFSTGFLIEDPEQMRNLSERNTENTGKTIQHCHNRQFHCMYCQQNIQQSFFYRKFW